MKGRPLSSAVQISFHVVGSLPSLAQRRLVAIGIDLVWVRAVADGHADTEVRPLLCFSVDGHFNVGG